MKEKLKFIGVFLLALVLSINTLNVYAADPSDDSVCGEGEELHTNYYLFLDVGEKSTYLNADHAGSASGEWSHYTEAPKFNNITKNISGNKTLINNGDVKIVSDDGALSNRPGDEEITWTATEYWKHLYDTSIAISASKSVNRIYEENSRTTYFLHNGNWRTYDPSSVTAPPTWTNAEIFSAAPTNSNVTNGLLGHIKDYYNNLGNSPLVKNGTGYPETTITSFIDVTKTVSYYGFRVERNYTTQTIDDSPGFTLDGKSGVIYSPAVYYAQFCTKSGSRKIEYNQNYEGDEPKNMPASTSYNTTCGVISDKTPERDGYRFLGWNTDKDADKPAMIAGTEVQKYAPGEKYCDGEDTLTLYAIWKAEDAEDEPFTITYDANKGTNAPAPQEGSTNSCVKISDQGKMTLDKNKFVGWSTKEDAAEADKKYAPGTEYCGENGDLTLYAVWNVSTGVSAHVIAFGLVAIAATGALVIAKKKNLFKQI